MDSYRARSQRRQSSRASLDRRVDKWIETGRQVVDGVAGTRPGNRRTVSMREAGSGLKKVGRWVGDKLDWIMEDEEGWLEPWQMEDRDSLDRTKRPLKAISLRVKQQAISSQSFDSDQNFPKEQWPDESAFRIEKWHRSQGNQIGSEETLLKNRRQSIGSEQRPLPRSSRRRDDW